MTTNNLVDLQQSGNVATLTINQPETLNTLSSAVLAQIEQAVDQVQANTDIRVLIITGAGDKAFVAGANIKEMKDKNVEEAAAFAKYGSDIITKIANLRQPVIAAVNGYALGGGCELALACDFRIASEKASFGQPEVNLGVILGFGGTQRLPRLIGPGLAKELIYTGRSINAQEAKRIGLVNRIVPADILLEEVEKIAQAIARNAPLAVEKAKEVVNTGLEMPLDEAISMEAKAFGSLFDTEDQQMGMDAFVNKEKASFLRK